jgi:enoyl-CoA hydratase/carnithine racemase
MLGVSENVVEARQKVTPSQYLHVRLDCSDGVATITLDRPEKGNALSEEMQDSLRAIWARIKEDEAIRVVVITGSGDRHFCTGGDVSTLDPERAGSALVNLPFRDAIHFSSHQNGVFKPVICAVNGLCGGGGLHFVVDADIVLASRDAAFFDAHVNVGQVGAIENIGLLKRLPLGTAMRMTLMGSAFRLNAERAYALGLVDELADDPTALRAAAQDMARVIARNSPQAMALSKQAMWNALETGYSQALEQGWALLRMHWSHPDSQEGPRAFVEKRDPIWNPDPNARR